MRFALAAIALLLAFSAQAQKEGAWTVKDPGSEDTRGHGTTAMAKLWQHHLAAFLDGR